MPKRNREIVYRPKKQMDERALLNPERKTPERGKAAPAAKEQTGSVRQSKGSMAGRKTAGKRSAVQGKSGAAASPAAEIRRLIRRKPDAAVTVMALLTAVFEVLGMLLASVHTQQTVGMDSLSMIAVVVPLGLVTTLLLPRFLPMDAMIMALTNFLCGVGIVTLCTVSPIRGNRQIIYYALGIGAMILMSLLVSNLSNYRGVTLLMMMIGTGALILPLVFGQWSNGAKNWVSIPLFGSFQPSELVKIAMVFSLAYYFSGNRTLLQMMPAIFFAAVCLLLLMLQRDLGTALIYYLSTLILFYIASGNIPLTVIGTAGGVGAAVLGYNMFAHVKVRVAMWRNPWSDPTGGGYQIIQALLAIGSGGLFGVGLGQGTPERIPEYYNDFIFAVICEQFGQVFGVLLITVYVLLIIRGVSMIGRARRSEMALLGLGSLAMLAVQTFMITAGVIKLIPLTGVTMPFLSYGGSSLLSCLCMVGILHGIAGRVRTDTETDILIKRIKA